MSEILCIIDGMTDSGFRPEAYESLSSFPIRKTMQTTPTGMETESLSCILNIMGVDPVPGNIRGWMEALGAGTPVRDTDLVFRGTWVELNEHGRAIGYEPHPPALSADFLPKDARYHSIGGYKAIVIFPGMSGMLDSVVTYPPHSHIGEHISNLTVQGLGFSKPVFQTQSCALVLWGQSHTVPMSSFREKTAVICGTDIVRGIARALKMELIPVEGVTGDTDTNLEAKVSAALTCALHFPYVILHINGADEAAHRLDREEKRRFLCMVDDIVLSRLLSSYNSVTVISDHGTDPASGKHINVDQPIFMRTI